MNAPTSQNTRFTRHGPVRVAPGGTYLQHADGTPFFYLADTAWNGALLSTEDEWAEYLADRKGKNFTAIQFILTAPWLGAPTDAEGRISFNADDALGPAQYSVNEDAFGRMDDRIRAVNEAGLLAVPVLAWAAHKTDPGRSLPEHFLARLVEFAVRRYSARDVLWVLGGDGRYDGFFRSRKWKRIGRQVFGSGPHAPVALHPVGLTWPYRWFRRERWLDVVGYQSSHSDALKTLRWLISGPPARDWRSIRKPFINFEPCYEGIRNWGGTRPFTHDDVRRAMYASLLNAPVAGITYGAHGVWSWEREPREPLNHPGSGVARPWREAMQFPGSFDAARLAALFTSIDWWRLQPADMRCSDWTWGRNWASASCRGSSRDESISVNYLPSGQTIIVGDAPSTAEWFDPRTGSRLPASATRTFTAPTNDDWLLIRRKLK